MKILLVAVNAKYIHTCPAIYSLKACADLQEIPDLEIAIAEYTINDRYQDVLAGIMAHGADVIGFSTYIWNVDRVRRLIRDIRRIRGKDVQLWAGGPEATYYPEPFLREDGADLCMLGEGEEVFFQLAAWVCHAHDSEEESSSVESTGLENNYVESTGLESDKAKGAVAEYPHFCGIAFLQNGNLISTGLAAPVDLDRIPFLYRDLTLFSNRILYYESSRGCPFSCAYCLSGRERGIRCRNLDVVKQELQFFLDQRVKQVKFIDRTFNASADFAMEIWRYLRDHDNGETNFHFEIEADRITEEELALLRELRPGLIQMEIGVQSANPDTLRSVHRRPDLTRIAEVMEALVPQQNINLHLDLIAGLPFEGMESFRNSFNTVYAMRPHQFQVGFLKLLKGTELYDRREEYGLVCSADAPYEVLQTKWLTYEELDLLHRISDRVEEYVNTQGFRRSLPLAEKFFPDAFALFEALAEYYRREGYEQKRPSVFQRYEIFSAFLRECWDELRAEERQTAADSLKSLKGDSEEEKRSDNMPEASEETELLNIMETVRLDKYLHTHPSRRMTAEETFCFGGEAVQLKFDYRTCSPVNGEAEMEPV